jgi:hypothetical protein
MFNVTLPLESGGKVTIFFSTSTLSVVESMKDPKTCRVLDGLHNNGGWTVKMTREACVKKIVEAMKV